MKQGDLFDPAAARAARDEALVRVSLNAADWWAKACAQVAQLRGWEGTGEDLGVLVGGAVGQPHNPNAWGALVAQAVRQEWLFRTGERRAMRKVRSHSRRTDVYRSR